MNDFSLDYEIHGMNELEVLTERDFESIRKNKKVHYLNVASCFDIETTSFYIDKETRMKAILKPSDKEEIKYEKQSVMYGFVFGLNGKVVLGRTWEEFKEILQYLKDYYQLGILKEDNEILEDNRLIVYVHNLSFEFQFLKDRFKWGQFFALDERKPVKIYAEEYGIEFRDSYALTGYSLEKVGEHLHKYQVEKKVGDLDYSKFRHSKTPLTKKEIGYMRNDSLVVMAHIQEEIERLGDITKLPLTKTGYVRQFVKNNCFYADPNKSHKAKENYYSFTSYRRYMNSLRIQSPQEYEQLKRAFQGGFTHANPIYSGELMKNVTSLDFTSSYPSVMIAEKYPCQNAVLRKGKIRKEDFEMYLEKYCCLFDVEFYDLKDTFYFDNYISRSKCVDIKGYTENNGRIVNASYLKTTLTELDFKIIKQTYSWKKMKISNLRTYMKNYLPTPFVKSIISLYKDKTQLKDVEGKEVEYMHSKENLNSCYGMSVTDIARPEFEFENGIWATFAPDLKEELEKYNKNGLRFLCYQWGIWVTAYARFNLWLGILELKQDHIYTDTDSLKMLNYEKHKAFFDDYNRDVIFNLKTAMRYHGFNEEDVQPLTINGVKKPLGVWDYDGHYSRFKTLGAKRYFVEYDDGKHSLTISGVNKKTAIPYLEEKAKKEKKDIFEYFNDEMKIDSDHTGKQIHAYIDYEYEGLLTDYKGVAMNYHEKSGLHLEKTSYSMSLADRYEDYLKYIKGEIKDIYE